MTGSASDTSTYRMRFEFLVSTYFHVDTREYAFELAGRPAVLKSVPERPLKETGAVTIQVGGFRDDSEALEFGYRLQRATTLAATKTDLGIDVGRNRNRTGVSAKIRENFFKRTGRILRNRVHGIDVFKEEPPVHTIVVEAEGRVTIDPQVFLLELEASFGAWCNPVSVDLERALRLRAEANFAGHNLVRMLLAIASVEALTPDELWTDKQKEMLQCFTTKACSFPGASPDEIEEIVERFTQMSKLSISQGFRRLFDRLGIQHLWPPWRDVYNFRSRILHGDVPPEGALAAVDEALRLSRQIVLRAAADEIAGADSVAAKFDEAEQVMRKRPPTPGHG
jgi:hypothetical protein